jgi:hypothetical protein
MIKYKPIAFNLKQDFFDRMIKGPTKDGKDLLKTNEISSQALL